MIIIYRYNIAWTVLVLLLVSLILLASDVKPGSTIFSGVFSENEPPELRGVWVQAKSITSKERIDELLKRVEAGNFNSIFAIVFVDGRALFQSKLVAKYIQEDSSFDPLAYLVAEAHRRDIEVHAWFALGRVGSEIDSPILSQHPEWRLVGPEGNTIEWLNFTRPDVRMFVTDLILEVVGGYAVDGIHLDYLRYPGPEWGFDAFSIEAFKQEFGLDLDEMRYADLPAFGKFQGNPLVGPGPAQVLAYFNNGVPALLLNQYGQGEVILMNWSAHRRSLAVGAEILQRSIRRLLDKEGQLYLLHSETNAQKYGYAGFDRVMRWLVELGWAPIEITETSIATLSPESVLVLPAVYLISPETAVQMSDFLSRGGGIIFIDGPTLSIHLEEIQKITGVKGRGHYFEEKLLMIDVVDHPLLPASARKANLEIYQTRDDKWKEFRQGAINALLEDIYKSVKAASKRTTLSVTIIADHKIASEVLLDWEDWLENDYVDYLVLRAYVDDINELRTLLESWELDLHPDDRIIFGIAAHTGQGESLVPKQPDQLVAEMRAVRASGSKGIIIFNIDTISDEMLKSLDSYFSSSFYFR